MSNSFVTRRQLLKSAGIGGALLLADSGRWSQGSGASPSGRILVRRDIASLTTDGPEIAALRRGIQVMKDRPASDPTSLIFQANIHATSDNPNPAWNHCQHGNFFFLPWHRMYNYWFERILRAAAGDPDLTVPYWNYANPAARTLPQAFREPADSKNSLFVKERNTDAGGINNGAALPASAAMTFWFAFGLSDFSTPSIPELGFAGLQVRKPQHSLSSHGAAESYHNLIHVLLGGDTGWMSDPRMSARDPIFWLHHANVDRLWKRWLDQAGGRHNAVSDAAWMDTRFPFFDEKGRKVNMAVRDALDTESQLGYRYDDDPPPVRHRVPDPAVVPRNAPQPPKLIAATKGAPVKLGTGNPVTVSLDLPEPARIAIERKDWETLFVLKVEGVKFDKEPMVYYEVYLNLPSSEKAYDFQSIHYVGNLIFAGLGAHEGAHQDDDECPPGGSRAFEITDAVRELRARGDWRKDNIAVTFVMRGLIPVKHGPVTKNGLKAQFEKLSLLAVNSHF